MSLGATFVAHVDVAAQNGGSTDFDSAHGTVLFAQHGRAVDLPVLRAAFAEDVGHFQGRLNHDNAGGLEMFVSDSSGLFAAWITELDTFV